MMNNKKVRVSYNRKDENENNKVFEYAKKNNIRVVCIADKTGSYYSLSNGRESYVEPTIGAAKLRIVAMQFK